MTSALLPWLESLSAEDWDRRPAGMWAGSPPSTLEALVAAEARLRARFPDDYRDLMLASDSGALIGPEESITLEPVDELVDRNTEDEYQQGLPGMLVIGHNAGGAVYFYDPTDRLGHGRWALYWVNLGDLALENARFAGKNLEEVLRRIAGGVSFFDEAKIGTKVTAHLIDGD